MTTLFLQLRFYGPVEVVLMGSTVPHYCQSASSLKLLLYLEGSQIPSFQPQRWGPGISPSCYERGPLLLSKESRR